MTRRTAKDLVLALVTPVLIYLPLNVGNGNLLREGQISSGAGLATWLAIWFGSVAIGYWFARRVIRPISLAVVYCGTMLALLGYLGLVTGLVLYGEGP